MIVEWGDRREGVMPEDAAAALSSDASSFPVSSSPAWPAASTACAASFPCAANMQDFADFVERLEAELGLRFRIVSGGHTNNLQFVASGSVPRRIDHLRVGEGILFGRDSICDVSLPGTHHDTFKVYAEVIEVKEKPSAPGGETGPDAFMRIREWPDLGLRRRAVLAMGEVDLSVQWITPTRPGVDDRRRQLRPHRRRRHRRRPSGARSATSSSSTPTTSPWRSAGAAGTRTGRSSDGRAECRAEGDR